MTEKLSRRDLLKAAGVAGVAATVPETASTEAAHQQVAQANLPPAVGQPPAYVPGAPVERGVLFFLNDEEARFIEAAVERLIPAEPEWPGAAWAGVLNFIDRQLAAAYGAGARMYLKGPWIPDAPPQQGYQLRYTPAQLYRIGIAEVRAHVTANYGGREFWDLNAPVMDEVLSGLESGSIQLPSMPSPVFFETLLANTVEGFFADPVYGGNREMVGWRMVGFPGAYAQYVDLVELYNVPFTRPPISIGDTGARHAYLEGHTQAGHTHGAQKR
ncbi:gluconate 2-dehydrogenase subunit 3 family protein [Microvirga splendida]|uniref:Gluconate 2-dehydrogenase subunit 3 family protein n=1 Tax=Microvirga splendida TaxID=2795727 RepID=A0ABS0Y414_9HYPH|nr:gluconate 2-dehydrogenase subunit 3 family protein [Microvirga splendida]